MSTEGVGPGVQEENQEHVDTMHERKQRMVDLADAFIAMPGGFGTMEELFEAATWTQLGIHSSPKSIGILNAGGFYDNLLAWMKDANAVGLVSDNTMKICISEADPCKLLDSMETHVPPPPFVNPSLWSKGNQSI
jgi:uncharacterized protein (TIGR00730 family)